MAVENLGTIGGKPKGVGDVFQGSDACGTSFRVGDMGYDPPHGPGPGRVSPQGG